MRVKINTKGLKSTAGMLEAAESKLAVLEKFLPEDETVNISVKCVKREQTLTLMTRNIYNGSMIKIERKGEDFYTILDDVADIAKHKLEKVHTKRVKQKKDQEKALKSLEYDLEADELEYNRNVITKHKKVKLEPMTPDQAITEMESLGHESFIFMNMETNSVCMVYAKNDGDYGIIETE